MHRFVLALACICLLTACQTQRAGNTGIDPQADCLAFVGARIYPGPGETPIENGLLIVQGDMIVALGTRSSIAIPGSAQIIDCSGLSISAGFWNSHVHFTELKWANIAEMSAHTLDSQLQDSLTRHGFTSVFDLSSDWINTQSMRARIAAGEVPGPRIHTVGEGLLPEGGTPDPEILARMGWMSTAMPEVVDAREASARTQLLADKGVDGIKLFASTQTGLVMAEGALEAAVELAHRYDLPVFAHPNTNADVRAAVDAGVDVLVHTTPQSGAWDAELLRLMAASEVALIPTLTLWVQIMATAPAEERAQTMALATEQLRSFHQSGARVLFGTDMGAVSIEAVEELALMRQAGMSFADILAALTTAPAELFLGSKGFAQVAIGSPADLVVFAGDPVEDIRSLAKVRYTMRAGKIIYRAPALREP